VYRAVLKGHRLFTYDFIIHEILFSVTFKLMIYTKMWFSYQKGEKNALYRYKMDVKF